MSIDQNVSLSDAMEVEYSTSQNLDNNEQLLSPPNQVIEALTIVKKYLSRQETPHEIKITKDQITLNGNRIFVDYEACKLCKKEHANLTCPKCERKVCSNCVTKRSNDFQCVKCKNTKKAKDKLASEFDEKLEKLFNLEGDDKIQEVIQVEVANLGGKSLEELIEVVKKLERKGEKLDRETSIVYFYVGKIFYEKMEEFFSEGSLDGEQKARKILGSFKHAKDLEFGEKRTSIKEIKEELGVDDKKVSRFFILTLKIYLVYKDFSSAEEQIRKAERIPSAIWLRDLSQDKFLEFWGKLEQRREEEDL